MFERLRELFSGGKLTETGLDRAVVKGWITGEQAEEIRREAAKTEEGKTTWTAQ